jgi:hypothetical protein
MANPAIRRRRREELQSVELVRLVAIYRRLAGIGEFQPLPEGLTFSGLLEAILDHEEKAGGLGDETG